MDVEALRRAQAQAKGRGQFANAASLGRQIAELEPPPRTRKAAKKTTKKAAAKKTVKKTAKKAAAKKTTAKKAAKKTAKKAAKKS